MSTAIGFHGRNWIAITALFVATACGDDSGTAAGPGPGNEVLEPKQTELESKLETLDLPPNFAIELYANEIPRASTIAQGPAGVVFVGTPEAVYAVVDDDLDRRVDAVVMIANDLASPTGVAYHDGDLFVAETERISRYPDIIETLGDPPAPTVVLATLPTEQQHGQRYIAFGPDGLLYIAIGAPCNVCEPADLVFGTIARMQPDGTEFEIFATGIRNSGGFDWHPESGELWFTDSGREGLGDNLPPDELNHAPEPGLHFGFPYCHGGFVLDPELGEGRSCDEFVGPVARLGPHVGALGMRFYAGDMLPVTYRNNVLVAEHGASDRATKHGHRVAAVLLAGTEAIAVEPLIDGFVDPNGVAWGRPADVAVLDDGSLLVSDDQNGALYRVTYAP